MEDVGEDCFEVELPRGQPFDDAHRGATARTRPRARRWRRRSGGGGGGAVASAARHVGQLAGAAARREQAEIADADEALRQDVQEKAPQEFLGVERQCADLAPVPIVLPPKRRPCRR